MTQIPINNSPDERVGERNKIKVPRLKLPVFKSRKILMPIVALVALGGLAAGGSIGYAKYADLKKENVRLSNPQEAAKAETDRLRSEVGQVFELPNEAPTIATVVDASKLKSQSFFANAQNGDRVLMFPQAKKAVLYRPATKKIIEVAPISIGENQGVAGSNTEEEPKNETPTNNTRR